MVLTRLSYFSSKIIKYLKFFVRKSTNNFILNIIVYIQPQNAPYRSYVVEDIAKHSNKVS